MTRILLWQEVHPTVRGGAESWLRDTAAGLRLLGHDVAWLQSEHIREALDQLRPDVVIMGTLHCFVGLEPVFWLSQRSIPGVWFIHDYWPFCGPRMLMRDHNRSDRSCPAVAGDCDNSCRGRVEWRDLVNRFHVATGCEGAAAIMRRHNINVRFVVEEGIDTAVFQPGRVRRDGPGVVYASAAGEEVWKGVHILRQAVERTGQELRFLTGLSRQQLAERLGYASIYAFPSVYQEIWGLALTEAMASGCAVVASDVVGARAQIHEEWGNGILVPPGDVTALRDALCDMAAHPEECERIGQRAREHVEKDHSLAALGRRWEAVCREVMAAGVLPAA